MNTSIAYSPWFIALFKKNSQLSPHTVLMMNNPLHAYVCEGAECQRRVNGADAPSSAGAARQEPNRPIQGQTAERGAR
jgi:uncharacterized protein YlaI